MLGIPGTRSVSEVLAGPGTTLTATTNTTDGTIKLDGTELAGTSSTRIVREDGPAFWALCATSANAANVGAARKVSAYNTTTFVLTTANSWPAALSINDTFTLREGFKRAPDGIDIDALAPGEWDRFFHLALTPPADADWYGSGFRTFECDLILRLRLLKRGRVRYAERYAHEQMAIIRAVLTRQDQAPTTNVRALYSANDQRAEVSQDTEKVVVTDRFRLVYRSGNGFF